MCMFGSKPPAPTPPKEYAAQRAPTRRQATTASERMRDRLSAATQTQQTNQLKFAPVDETGKKELLGV